MKAICRRQKTVPSARGIPDSEKQRLELVAVQRSLGGFDKPAEIRDDGIGLLRRVVLPHGDKEHVLCREQPSDVLRGCTERIVCRDREQERPRVAQV